MGMVFPPMQDVLPLYFVASYAVGPLAVLVTTLSRGLKAALAQHAVEDWRRYLPAIMIPLEWLLPPALILLRFGEIQSGWLPVRLLGFALGIFGAVMLLWAPVTLGRFFVHKAVVFQDHALVTAGPYRFVRHPVYSGYLAMLLGSGLGTLNLCLLLLWPFSLLGILVQARSEEQLLESKFGQVYQNYAGRTGQLIPRFWGRTSSDF